MCGPSRALSRSLIYFLTVLGMLLILERSCLIVLRVHYFGDLGSLDIFIGEAIKGSFTGLLYAIAALEGHAY